jgi:hypothetical protein
MPTQRQREVLTDVWKTLDGIVEMARDAEDLRVELQDRVSRSRVAPGDVSVATIVGLRQKLNGLLQKYDECADEARDAVLKMDSLIMPR